MNFVKGYYERSTGRFTVDNFGPVLDLGAERWNHSGSAILGLSPEHLRIDPAAPEAQIKLIKPTGSETHLIFDWAGQSLTAVLRERIESTAGEKIAVGVDPKRVHLFNSTTSNRLIEISV